MDSVIKTIYEQDLTGQEVAITTNGKCPVHLYHDLLNFNHIKEVIGPHNACIVLFPVKSASNGHWIAILYHPETNTIEHFDSYGFSPDTELQYSSDPETRDNLLMRFYNQARNEGYNFIHNQYRFQKLKDNVNTCGKHASIRCRFRYLNIDDYAKLMLGQKESADYLVSILTFITLRDNKIERDVIEKVLKRIK